VVDFIEKDVELMKTLFRKFADIVSPNILDFLWQNVWFFYYSLLSLSEKNERFDLIWICLLTFFSNLCRQSHQYCTYNYKSFIFKWKNKKIKNLLHFILFFLSSFLLLSHPSVGFWSGFLIGFLVLLSVFSMFNIVSLSSCQHNYTQNPINPFSLYCHFQENIYDF
jgi:hypothetical protein